MARGEVIVQRVRRKGMDDLYVAGIGGVSVAFYSLEQLSEWLMDKGIPFEDPVWDYIDELVTEID